MRGIKSGFFHRSGCEYIQEWMRMVSEYTEEDANSFREGLITAELTPSGARKDLAGQMVKLAGLEEA